MWKPGSDKPSSATAPSRAAPAKSAPAKSAAAPSTSTPTGNEARPTSKSALSQKTLAMKFMQRKKQAEARKQSAVQERKKQDAWVVDSPEDDGDSSAISAIVCLQDVADPSLPLIFGRRSFGGFNKAVEDEYRDVSRQQRFAASEEKELRDEVSAEEMTDRMIKYTGLMRGGNSRQGSRGPQQKRQRK